MRTSFGALFAIVITLAAASRVAADAAPLELEPTTTQPEALASFGACVEGSWVYVYGGHIGRAHQHSIDNLSKSFRRLSLLDHASWEELPAGPPLQSVAVVAHEGSVYRLGGLDARNRADEKEELWSTGQVARFDTVTREWHELPALPEPRSSHDACLLGHTIYVAAGWSLGEERRWLTTAYCLDLKNVEAGWVALPPAPFKRRAVDLTSYQDRIYVMGGITPSGKLSSEVDVFDPQTQTWTRGPMLPGNGFGASGTACHGQLVVSGMDGVVLTLDADASSWSPVGRLALPRFFHRMVPVSESTVACIAGATEGGHIRWTEYFDLTAPRDEPRLTVLQVPYPGRARNRQASFLHKNTLYLSGGNNSLAQHDFEPENFVSEGFAISIPGLGARPVSEFPVARQSQVVATVAKGRSTLAYAVGGFGHDGGVSRAHADVFRFDLSDKRWQKAAARLPEPRTQFGIGDHDGKLWLFGGLDYDPSRGEQSFQYPREVLTLDLSHASEFRETGFSIPRPRRAFGGAQLGSRYYLVGGMRENFQTVSECDVFDFDEQVWSELPSPSVARISPQLVPFEGRLYLIGGSSPKEGGGFTENRSVEVYDPRSRAWRCLVKELPFSVRHIRAFPMKHRIALTSTHLTGASGVRIGLLETGLPAVRHATSRPSSRGKVSPQSEAESEIR